MVLVEGPTCIKYVVFYIILFAENTLANVVWIVNADEAVRNTLYYIPIILLNIVPFIFGIMFMLLYYKVFHPSTGYNRQQPATSS